ncbi:MAG: hypothetical protein HY720_14145 [Planctomycetes bacterium]|nr:hypothetical protein [Planctomycetota bacterium]
MRQVSIVEFRKHAAEVIERLRRGERLVLTHRRKPIAQLEPIRPGNPSDRDPFYALDRLADATAGALSNDQIERAIYGA